MPSSATGICLEWKPEKEDRIVSEQPPHGEYHRSATADWLDANERHRIDAGLRRRLTPRGPSSDVLDLASNDYLGLGSHADVKAAAIDAVEQWGTGSTGSRLVTGTTTAHTDLEARLAEFMGQEAALVFSSGYAANLGAVTALAGRGCLIVSDGGSHASLVDACRLSRARVVVIERGDVEQARIALSERTEERALLVTDSVYSVDGALAPLRELYEVAQECGALMIADEAHGLGVRGSGGRGWVDELGLAGREDLVVTATLSKALGSQGGVVLGSRRIIDHIIDTARTFIFDTGLNPAAVGAAGAALEQLDAKPELARAVRDHAHVLAEAAGAAEPQSAVVSVIIGEPADAVAARDAMRERGVSVGCFRPPSVPVGTSRLRLTARANLTQGDLDRACAALREVLAEHGPGNRGRRG